MHDAFDRAIKVLVRIKPRYGSPFCSPQKTIDLPPLLGFVC